MYEKKGSPCKRKETKEERKSDRKFRDIPSPLILYDVYSIVQRTRVYTKVVYEEEERVNFFQCLVLQ